MCLIYTSAWMMASHGSDAAFNDLQLFRDVIEFRKFDVLQWHLW